MGYGDCHDVIVAGAGSSGVIVAIRLAQRGLRVLLLEAGPDFPDGAPIPFDAGLTYPLDDLDWGYMSEGDREIPIPRGKLVGGSSAVNAASAIRPQPADLDGWNCPQWTFDACLPALRRLESDREFGSHPWHGADGPIHIERPAQHDPSRLTAACLAAAAECAYPPAPDLNAPAAHGAGPQPANVRHGRRQSVLATYLARHRGEPTLQIRPMTHVLRVLVSGGRATGVRTEDGVLHAGAVVLAAGTFGSPTILMHSGVGPAAHLREHGISPVVDLPVGEGLSDHAAVTVLALEREGEHRTAADRFMIRVADGVAGQEHLHIAGPYAAPAQRRGASEGVFAIVGCVTQPQSRGQVRLRSADPGQQAAVTLNYYREQADREAAVECAERIRELLAAPSLAAQVQQVLLPPPGLHGAGLAGLIDRTAITEHHACGTCALGSVVDERLRVFGVAGLFVVDASVIPVVPRANTNVPAMMVAERFAELAPF
jgi:choline dehydrogenase